MVTKFTALWALDPAVAYLNHASFGACPRAVLDAQSALRLEMEREPVDFLSGSLPGRLEAARAELARFLGADAADLVFVANATSGVNAVLRSLALRAEDELLVTSHGYAACRKVVEFVAQRAGARVVTAQLPFPCPGAHSIVEAVLGAVSARTRIALIDHVTSPTALILPVERLVRELGARGIDVLIDGAHAPGMLPLRLSELGAAYYTGNAHKWLCAPKGAAFLHVRRDRQAGLHAHVISHGFEAGFQAEFDWIGTIDPTPWLCIPEALRHLGGQLAGGWPQLMAANRRLALGARDLVLARLGIAAPAPDELIGAMASIPLPAGGSAAPPLDTRLLHDRLRARGVEAWLHPHPVPLLRVSAQLYNDLDQYERLAALLEQALRGA
ncbi:MAG TPA: aminotransferase class V-fold PLP-dependent enzyme [Steroidobacteraceae bacterium]|nr:aminotransferase class V-fold PLP-dependent enzyme [Steroidobacteraceae bacterium]